MVVHVHVRVRVRVYVVYSMIEFGNGIRKDHVSFIVTGVLKVCVCVCVYVCMCVFVCVCVYSMIGLVKGICKEDFRVLLLES